MSNNPTPEQQEARDRETARTLEWLRELNTKEAKS